MPLKMNFGMRTNNRVESFFGRMKIFVEKIKTTGSFLNDFIDFLQSKENKNNNKFKRIYLKQKNIQKNQNSYNYYHFLLNIHLSGC